MEKKKIIFSNYECNTQTDWEDANVFIEDERANLNETINGTIVALADLGLWNGRKIGYNVFGANISKILSSECDYAEWYAKNYNVWGRMSHHDGTNYVLYRVIPFDKNADRIIERIVNSSETYEEAVRKLIKNSKSLYPYVAKVYGWKYRKSKNEQ